MEFTSLSFGDNEAIPACYARAQIGLEDALACVVPAENYNPQFSWDEVPPGTQSFALICLDRHAPSKYKREGWNQNGQEIPADLPRVNFFHWVLLDLPAHKREISEGEFSSAVGSKGGAYTRYGARHGLNDYTRWFESDEIMRGDYFGYDGPCPPWNDSVVHHYVFTLYALDISRVDIEDRFTGEAALDAIQGNILAQASLTGTYTLNHLLAPTMIGSPTVV